MKNNKYLEMKTYFFYEFGDCYFDEPTVDDLKKKKKALTLYLCMYNSHEKKLQT